MKSKIYQFRFDGLWLGGDAIISAGSKEEAWSFLKERWPDLEPIEECGISELSDKEGILFFDSGDY